MILLSTYPRTGQHLLHGYLLQQINVKINTTHFAKNEKSDILITTVRNPIDTISSHVSMTLKNDKNNKIINEKVILQSCNYSLLKYIMFYKDIKNIADVFISYKKLMEDPQKTLSSLYEKLNLKPINNDIDVPIWRDGHTDGYIVSSKNLKFYNDVKVILKDCKQIKECIDIYNDLEKICL
jgi:hypothetical protein